MQVKNPDIYEGARFLQPFPRSRFVVCTRTGKGADYEAVVSLDVFGFKPGFPKTSLTCQPLYSMDLIKCSIGIVHPVSERQNPQVRDASHPDAA